MRLACSLVFILIASMFDAGPAMAADTQVERMRQAVRRAQDAARQAEQERAALLTEKQTLQSAVEKSELQSKGLVQEVGSLRAALAAEQARSAKLATEQARSAKLATEIEALRKLEQQHEARLRTQSTALEEARSLGSDLAARLKETQRTLDVRVAEGMKIGAENERTKAALASCERDNSGLYQVSVELAQKFTGLNYWDGVMRREPLFRFERVELENLMERYRDEIEPRRR